MPGNCRRADCRRRYNISTTVGVVELNNRYGGRAEPTGNDPSGELSTCIYIYISSEWMYCNTTKFKHFFALVFISLHTSFHLIIFWMLRDSIYLNKIWVINITILYTITLMKENRAQQQQQQQQQEWWNYIAHIYVYGYSDERIPLSSLKGGPSYFNQLINQ